MASLKSLRIVLESTKLHLKVSPVAAGSLEELEDAVAALEPAKVLLR